MVRGSHRADPRSSGGIRRTQSQLTAPDRRCVAAALDVRRASRNDCALQVAADSHVVSEIVRLRDSIGREAAAIQTALNDHSSASADGCPRWGQAEHEELRRQLGALDQHVAQAPARSQDPPDLRAEFATLLCFAKTLRIDAESWRAAFEAGLRELEREETAARKERGETGGTARDAHEPARRASVHD